MSQPIPENVVIMYLKIGLFYFLLFMFTSTLAAKTVESIKKQKAADWIVEHEVSVPETLPLDAIEGGKYYALVDVQIRAEEDNEPIYFYHYAQLIVNQQGLESGSEINIKFDPIYESLVFNSIRIHRDGQTIDKLPKAKISLLQQETEQKDFLYNGQLTANIILDDIRVGDIIEYSYTRKGANPVYNNIFSYERYIEWELPVYQQRIRMLWGKTNPLFVTKLNTDIEISERQLDSFKEYNIEINHSKPSFINDETPDWHDPYGIIFFSELKNWSDVAAWAVPLYSNAIETSPELVRIASDIQTNHQDQRQQIVQALKFVQSEIRYLGIEMGSNSHKPTPANQTLQRRYGDCKDKAVLFISLLKLLGIKASAALVNTERTNHLADQPPTVNAFDHVLVKVTHQDETFWLDPTRRYQNSTLDDIYQPDYRYALVIDNTNKELEKMATNLTDVLTIKEHFDLSKGSNNDVVLDVNSQYFGYEAENLRYDLANNGLNKLQENYLEFYRGYYSDVEPLEKPKVRETNRKGIIHLKEKYLLKNFWEANPDKKWYEAIFFASSITSSLTKPKQIKRISPYSIRYPDNIKQTIEAKFGSDNWDFDDDEVIEDNAFFFYKFSAKFNNDTRTLTLIYDYKSKTDHVPSKDIDEYMAARKHARETIEYAIVEYFKSDDLEQKNEEHDIVDLIFYSILSLYTVAILFIIINWLIDTRNHPIYSETMFYQVSLPKLLALSILTFNIYLVYWFYRNWLHVKSVDKSSIMPIARGLFNIFWYYPFYNRLVEDSLQRYQANKVLIKPFAILLASSYFVVNILAETDYLGLQSIILIPILLIPLANYINHIDTNDRAAYTYNSRWLFRHTLLALFVLPVILLASGKELNILPSNKVVEGREILQRDIKFMHRNGIFPANEKIIYFYSNALFNTRNDGNGFTDNLVFSYWKDDEAVFKFEKEYLSRVKNIEESYPDNPLEDTTINIVREDDSYFTLYVSRERNMDKKFVTKLMERWRKSRQDH
jgi:transglutaminase-like putative cysteine protease